MNDLDPPAIVKSVADYNALLADAKSIYGAYAKAEDANVTRALELGRILIQMKEVCPHGMWEKTLEKIGVAQQRANEFMRIAKSPDSGDLKTGTITQAITSVSAPAKTDTPTIYCRPCRTGGAKPNCKTCKELRKKENPDADPISELEQEIATSTGGSPPPKVPVDLEGHPIPEPLLLSFSVLEHFKEAERLRKSLQEAMDKIAKTPGGEHLKAKLRPVGDEKVTYKSEELSVVKRDLKYTRPYSVCPWCKAKDAKCNVCHGEGWVEKMTWDGADDATKARLS